MDKVQRKKMTSLSHVPFSVPYRVKATILSALWQVVLQQKNSPHDTDCPDSQLFFFWIFSFSVGSTFNCTTSAMEARINNAYLKRISAPKYHKPENLQMKMILLFQSQNYFILYQLQSYVCTQYSTNNKAYLSCFEIKKFSSRVTYFCWKPVSALYKFSSSVDLNMHPLNMAQ